MGTAEEKRKVVEGIMIMNMKRDESIKTRLRYNGKSTREWISNEDNGECGVMTNDVPNAFIQAVIEANGDKGNDKIVMMKLTGVVVDLLIELAPEIYNDFVVLENGKKVLYVNVLRNLYSMLDATAPDWSSIIENLRELDDDMIYSGLLGVLGPIKYNAYKAGYVILLVGCPLFWSSTLQRIITCSTQHSEYVALSTACRDLIPIRSLLKELAANTPGRLDEFEFVVKSTCFEDNSAALVLARVQKITAQNRHIAVRYHWFRSHVLGSGNPDAFLDIVKVESDAQVADGFTKNLTKDKFLAFRKLLCNW